MKLRIYSIYKGVVLFDLALLAFFFFVFVNSQADNGGLSRVMFNNRPIAVAGFDQAVDEEATSPSTSLT